MTGQPARTVRVDVASRLELLDIVQSALGHATNLEGFDEDAAHFIGVAVRESVVNAMKHGNRLDESKRVEVELILHEGALEVLVRDQGQGFDPERVANPLADENLLKPAGRGMFFMRSFMDEVSYSFSPGSGTLVRMVKRVP